MTNLETCLRSKAAILLEGLEGRLRAESESSGRLHDQIPVMHASQSFLIAK